MPGSCGVKLATNFCAPKALTDDVTRPPLTRISKLPDPAREPSTAKNETEFWLTIIYSNCNHAGDLLSNSTGRPSTPLEISWTRMALAPKSSWSIGRN